MTRRDLLHGAAIGVAGALLTGRVDAATRQGTPMNATRMSSGGWDCHTHIYGPFDRFPLAPNASYMPEPAPFSDLLALHAKLGITHGVLVQAAPYGTDHAAILDAIVASGGRYRGIGVIDATITDAELQALHDGGIRGIRFNLMSHLPGNRDPAALRRTAERVRALGWHVLVHGEMPVLVPVLEQWRTLATPLVIDHMARPDLTDLVDEAQVASLTSLLRHPGRWIKLSGADRAMRGAPGLWPRATAHARVLLEAAPDRAIWGTDWPHPNITGPVPDDAALLDFVLDVCATPERARAVLVDNPGRLYA